MFTDEIKLNIYKKKAPVRLLSALDTNSNRDRDNEWVRSNCSVNGKFAIQKST